ncbi:hypothetical protein [Flavobacterium sp. ov086]|uniref:hypothetical protein n=1 Tax=Flavobacterium sp. ov086 TaxID=1761785 RepID=UPI000B686458|nr:hypothetical protein [Flavobacterium sp. ov086]SNR84334.1 hypothetical protein SAMN04487979_12478 [Flavobacterium sp. ov086]
MRNKKIKKYGFLLILAVLLSSCKITDHEFYFDIKQQAIKSCDNVGILKLMIKNDSIKLGGFLYEDGKFLVWKGDPGLAPDEFSFINVNKDFHYFEGKSARDFKFKSNCKYTIENSGGGNPSFKIRIWTDSVGKVYKTTHPTCGLKSLEEDGYVNVPK